MLPKSEKMKEKERRPSSWQVSSSCWYRWIVAGGWWQVNVEVAGLEVEEESGGGGGGGGNTYNEANNTPLRLRAPNLTRPFCPTIRYLNPRTF